MPTDSKDTVPVLVHMDRKDWEKFKEVTGKRKASQRLRHLVRADLNSAIATTR